MTVNPQQQDHPPTRAILAFLTIVAGTTLGLAGIDLVLPSVPFMPQIFGTTQATAQMVLAAYVAGSTVGLLLFGSLASHFGRRRLFIASLAAFALVSLASALVDDIWALIGLRLLQGAAASGSAVLAPGLIRGLFSELGAVRAIGAMGSIEALVPGLAPIAGAWLHKAYGWQMSFNLTGILCLAICLLVFVVPSLLPHIGRKQGDAPSSYLKVVANPTFLRYGLSHALILGALLTFVFSAPAVIIQTMGGTIEDFILMQFIGVSCFIVSANLAGNLVKRWGTEAVITAGTCLSLLGTLLLLGYALFGVNDPMHLSALFWVLNTGLGIRGGAGFVRALTASHGDDERASAIIILATTGIAAVGTALVAPFILMGLTALTIMVVAIILPAVILILAIKPLEDNGEEQAPVIGQE
ncbi:MULTISPECIES: MFS transporter [Kordiimonas]|jgi:predicted MFS family arabinose efflux permease|uniref:MFS transporter n=1 Tax=Kordiimonas TaxID=288021 RepID=UPI00257A6E6C|nr:MFS transporter [Kordiimonas sp. UBA4487]